MISTEYIIVREGVVIASEVCEGAADAKRKLKPSETRALYIRVRDQPAPLQPTTVGKESDE